MSDAQIAEIARQWIEWPILIDSTIGRVAGGSSGLLIGCGRGCHLRFQFSCLRIVRIPRNFLRRMAPRQCEAMPIVRQTGRGFAAVAFDAQATTPVIKPTFATFAGFAWVILRMCVDEVTCDGMNQKR